MNWLSEFLAQLLFGSGADRAFWVVSILILIYVSTRNYRSLRRELPPLVWPDGETPLRQIDANWLLFNTRTVLTNQRVLHWKAAWLFSGRSLKSVALKDVKSVLLHRHLNWGLLLLAAYFLGTYNPWAVLLLLLGLQCHVYAVHFSTPFAHMPLIRITAKTSWRRQLSEVVRFYEHSQIAWIQAMRGAGQHAAQPTGQPTPAVETDFRWSRPVLIFVFAIVAAGILQRGFETHLTFDEYVFAPLYLALPAAIASRSLRDGLWVALLAFVGLLAVKFPGTPWMGLPGPDGAPFWTQYGWALGTLLLIAGLAHLASRFVNPALAPVAVLLWIAFAAKYIPDAWVDLSLYTKLALAAAAAVVLSAIDSWLASSAERSARSEATVSAAAEAGP